VTDPAPLTTAEAAIEDKIASAASMLDRIVGDNPLPLDRWTPREWLRLHEAFHWIRSRLPASPPATAPQVANVTEALKTLRMARNTPSNFRGESWLNGVLDHAIDALEPVPDNWLETACVTSPPAPAQPGELLARAQAAGTQALLADFYVWREAYLLSKPADQERIADGAKTLLDRFVTALTTPPAQPVAQATAPVHTSVDSITEPGWYWHDAEYDDEGSCGPFDTREAALSAGTEAHEGDAEHVGVFYFDGKRIGAPAPPAANAELVERLLKETDFWKCKHYPSGGSISDKLVRVICRQCVADFLSPRRP